MDELNFNSHSTPCLAGWEVHLFHLVSSVRPSVPKPLWSFAIRNVSWNDRHVSPLGLGNLIECVVQFLASRGGGEWDSSWCARILLFLASGCRWVCPARLIFITKQDAARRLDWLDCIGSARVAFQALRCWCLRRFYQFASQGRNYGPVCVVISVLLEHKLYTKIVSLKPFPVKADQNFPEPRPGLIPDGII